MVAVRAFAFGARLVAAAGGGYALAIAVAVCLSRVLPTARADAVLAGLFVSFPVYAGAIVWAFGVRSLLRIWSGLAAATVGFAGLAGLFSAILP